MATRTRRAERREEPLSRERIVEAAIGLLDTAGEGGLTFRALAERLATGPGAIYWHVANKDELLAAATDAVVAGAVAIQPAESAESDSGSGSARDGIHAVALRLFEAAEEHPWLAPQLAAQLSRGPGGTVAPRIFEGIGRQVRALGVPESNWFAAASALMHYVLGAAGQNVANSARARALGSDAERAEFLDAVSAAWEELDPDEYAFTRAVTGQLREHDDREQFLAGIDFIITGITAPT